MQHENNVTALKTRNLQTALTSAKTSHIWLTARIRSLPKANQLFLVLQPCDPYLVKNPVVKNPVLQLAVTLWTYRDTKKQTGLKA